MSCRYRVIVVVPPEPVVTPAEVPGDHAADDATVAALIAAATAEIDGPAGWLGRAIGPQTIELRTDGFWPGDDKLLLPYRPIIEIVSLIYVDAADVEITVTASDYALAGQRFYVKPSFTYPTIGPDHEGVRIRYRAGYDGPLAGSPPGMTGEIPAPIKQWIKLRTTQLMAMVDADPLIRSETTQDLDSFTYIDRGDGGSLYDALLSPYRVYG